MAKGNRKQSGDGEIADGVSRDRLDWESIDWAHHEAVVRRLQERIVKATQEGNRDKVHDLARLLKRSHSAKLLAVKRVTENDGSKTPGVDKVTWTHPRSKEMAVESLGARGYKPQPLRRIHIPKSNGKSRPLGIPAMRDRAMQALHLLALDPAAETTADSHSYGFRRGRSCADAIEQCFNLLSGGRDRWILEGDIKGCFDHISHEWLMEHVPMDRSILRKWLQCGVLEGNVFADTTEGTPQGGIVSPVLANLALDGLEALLAKQFPGRGAKRVGFVRYADDFVVTASSKELLDHSVRPLLVDFLRERGLELSEEKTKITHLRDGFDFLGQNIRAFGDKTIIQPSKKNIAAFLSKVRLLINSNKQARAAALIQQLNPLIRGWANYHRHVCSKKAFSNVDNQIHRCLMAWARRRHLRESKNRHWVAAKYFGTQGGRRWCFFGDRTVRNGDSQRDWLLHAAKTRIERHRKVAAQAHPYDPAWLTYWQNRRQRRRLSPASDVTLTVALWSPRLYTAVTEA